MIDFTIPEEVEKLQEATQKFIFDTVIPMEKDKRQDSHYDGLPIFRENVIGRRENEWHKCTAAKSLQCTERNHGFYVPGYAAAYTRQRKSK